MTGPNHHVTVDGTRDFALPTGQHLNGAVSGGRQLLLESVTRRLRTRRGALFYDLNYGCSLLDFLGESFQDRGGELAAVLEVELEDDPRVQQALVQVTELSLNGVTLQVILHTTAGLLQLGVTASGAPAAVTPHIEVIQLGSQ